jgi:hypothetical protein
MRTERTRVGNNVNNVKGSGQYREPIANKLMCAISEANMA